MIAHHILWGRDGNGRRVPLEHAYGPAGRDALLAMRATLMEALSAKRTKIAAQNKRNARRANAVLGNLRARDFRAFYVQTIYK